MVQKSVKSDNEEPKQLSFQLPSEEEHLFQCTDVDEEMEDDPDIVYVKLEVVGGKEEGRTMMARLSLDDQWKGFFGTRLFLKAIKEEYKGDEFPIDTDNWIGRQFYATVIHNENKAKTKTYANVDEYNFEREVDQTAPNPQKGVKDANECKCPIEEVKTEKDPNNADIDVCKKCKKPVMQWD